jgi:hypothetical protein
MGRSRLHAALFWLTMAAVAITVIAVVASGDWLFLGFLASFGGWYALAFRAKLNRNRAVPTEHGVDGRIEAIEYFWRPG